MIDIVFAGAGIAKFAPLPDLSEALFDELIDIHLKGTFFTVQGALPHMRDGGSVTWSLPRRPNRKGPP